MNLVEGFKVHKPKPAVEDECCWRQRSRSSASEPCSGKMISDLYKPRTGIVQTQVSVCFLQRKLHSRAEWKIKTKQVVTPSQTLKKMLVQAQCQSVYYISIIVLYLWKVLVFISKGELACIKHVSLNKKTLLLFD